MKFAIVILTSVLSASAFATPNQACLDDVKSHSISLKAEAKEIIDTAHNKYAQHLKRQGEPAIAKSLQEEAKAAEEVLGAIRTVASDQPLSIEGGAYLDLLCQFDLNVDQVTGR